MRIGLIGDFDEQVTAHRAIPEALRLSAEAVGVTLSTHWLRTDSIASDADLEPYALLWCVPASPYRSMEGALRGIRFARERGVPFLGTCGGFQHTLIERARNVLHMAGADHAESNPGAEAPIVTALACPLVEAAGDVYFQPGSMLRRVYGADEFRETYRCSYALNPAYERALGAGDLRFVGRDPDGSVRACELHGHPFFVATLYQPERSALRGDRHPLITAFVAAAATLHPTEAKDARTLNPSSKTTSTS